jgi:hypothetical protein
MVVLKPLYGIAEAGIHWWVTYSKHHRKKLSMDPSTYDPCLLISTDKNKFRIVAMQTDDTLGLSDDQSTTLEDEKLKGAKFTAKPKETLSDTSSLQFNGCAISIKENGTLNLRQKGQEAKIESINIEASNYQQSYVQRARGAYIASICQPEATFNLSAAAQHQEPTQDDVRTLNKRLEWQIKNPERGLK